MATSFENLVINRIIAHEISRKDVDGHIQPNYSDEMVQLHQKAMQELQNRIVQALGHNSYAIEMVITKDDDGSVFQFTKQIMEDDESNEAFIKISKKITEKLSYSQFSRIIPGGAVIVFDGVTGVGAQRYLGIIKSR